jgi:hypothetical protein
MATMAAKKKPQKSDVVVEMNIRGSDKAEKTGSHLKNLACLARTMTKKK